MAEAGRLAEQLLKKVLTCHSFLARILSKLEELLASVNTLSSKLQRLWDLCCELLANPVVEGAGQGVEESNFLNLGLLICCHI